MGDVNADSVRGAFYSAIAAALPIVLLTILVRIGVEADEGIALEEGRLDSFERARELLQEGVESLTEAERVRDTTLASSEKRGKLAYLDKDISERRAHLEQLRLRMGDLGRGSLRTERLLRWFLGLVFAVAFIGETACLSALATGDSSELRFVAAVYMLYGMFGLLFVLEDVRLTERSRRRADLQTRITELDRSWTQDDSRARLDPATK